MKKNSNVEMKKRNRTIFMLLAIIVIIIIIICVIRKKALNNENRGKITNEIDYVETIENGIKINRSTHLNESKTVNGMTFTNIQLTTKEGMTTLLADVINNSGKRTELKTVKIKLVDEDNNELVTVNGVIKALNPGESSQLNIGMTSNYIESYDIKIEF